MRSLPIFVQLQGQPCLLVGGGEIAARKARTLRNSGADITVVAPALGDELSAVVSEGEIRYINSRFAPEHLDRHLLVVAATGDRQVNQQVADAAAAACRLCNVVDDPELCSFTLPAIVDRAPLTIAIGTEGTSPVLARLLRERIEDWLPDRIGRLLSWSGRWRRTVAERIGSLTERRKFWEQVLDGSIADAVLNNREQDADRAVERALAADHAAAAPGEAWLVGAGPGDPGLLTRRATEVMRRADVILYDRLVSAEVLALGRRDARLIAVGKAPQGPSVPQNEINELLVALVGQGLRVCRLKGGDPFIFGRGGEEAAALRSAGYQVEVVPGITAAIGCAAAAQIPLTHRDTASAVTMVTGHDAGETGADWPALAAGRQTLAMYMSVGRLPVLSQQLIEHGRAAQTPAAIIENGTYDEQRIVTGTLETIADVAREQRIAAPALLIVGDVVAQAGTLQPTKKDQRRPDRDATLAA